MIFEKSLVTGAGQYRTDCELHSVQFRYVNGSAYTANQSKGIRDLLG
jgi:hypothetical protein